MYCMVVVVEHPKRQNLLPFSLQTLLLLLSSARRQHDDLLSLRSNTDNVVVVVDVLAVIAVAADSGDVVDCNNSAALVNLPIVVVAVRVQVVVVCVRHLLLPCAWQTPTSDQQT